MQIERKMSHRTYPVFTKSKVLLQNNSIEKIENIQTTGAIWVVSCLVEVSKLLMSAVVR